MAYNLENLFENTRVYHNTMILCVTWSVSSYSFYFVEFYLRLLPTNTIYMQKCLMGCADMFATVLYYVLITKLGMVQSFRILFSLLAMSSLSLVVLLAIADVDSYAVAETTPAGLAVALSALIMCMRVTSFATFAINYS